MRRLSGIIISSLAMMHGPEGGGRLDVAAGIPLLCPRVRADIGHGKYKWLLHALVSTGRRYEHG